MGKLFCFEYWNAEEYTLQERAEVVVYYKTFGLINCLHVKTKL